VIASSPIQRADDVSGPERDVELAGQDHHRGHEGLVVGHRDQPAHQVLILDHPGPQPVHGKRALGCVFLFPNRAVVVHDGRVTCSSHAPRVRYDAAPVGELAHHVRIRDAEVGDEVLLRSVDASTHAHQLELLGLHGDEASAFLDLQYRAKGLHIADAHPGAVQSVITVDRRPVGRLVVDRRRDDICIVDLALLALARRAGVGTSVVASVTTDADVAGVPVRCQVAIDNPALAFWTQLGFRVVAGDDANVSLERPCVTSPR
jgi:GNAT superfamily N-acetyltransferase